MLTCMWRSETGAGCLPLLLLTLVFEIGSLTELSGWLQRAGQQAPGVFSVSSSLLLGLQMPVTIPRFLYGC